MRPWASIPLVLLLCAAWSQADCAQDHRSNKNAGILVTDFTIAGTQTISATELARITGNLIGSCFDDDPEELGERIRALFQDRGYFAVEVKHVGFKPGDPLAIPKPVTMDADIAEGPLYKLAEITFVDNHAIQHRTPSPGISLKKRQHLQPRKSRQRPRGPSQALQHTRLSGLHRRA